MNYKNFFILIGIITLFTCSIYYQTIISSTREVRQQYWNGKYAYSNKETFDDAIAPINKSLYVTTIENFINENSINESYSPNSFNIYHYKFDLITKMEEKCARNTEILDLVFLVLSYIERRKFRDAIRETWGAEDRFRVRTVFLMGIDSRNASVREEILRENEEYQDIVLADYEDTYHNNSIKYIMGLDWAVRFCSQSKFYILADDDAYFNVRKLLKYLASHFVPYDLIKQYPEMFGNFHNEELSNRVARRKIRLFGGIVMTPTVPQRSGKFAISEQEFPYSNYVPFVNGHATIMSRDVIDELLEAARHTKFMWLDDVYFGFLVAWAGIPITNIPDIIYEHPKEYGDETFDKYISTHYMPSPEDLLRIWKLQKERGNA